MMKVAVVNKTPLSTAQATALVRWVAECFEDVGVTVKVTLLDRPNRWGVSGKAYFPVTHDRRRTIKPGEFAVRIFVGRHNRPSYPHSFAYKKLAGAYAYNDKVEELVHVVAHELRHVEQFWAFERNNPGWKRGRVSSELGLALGNGPVRFGRYFRAWEKKAYRYGSCEVDAEVVAHGITDAYRYWRDNVRASQ